MSRFATHYFDSPCGFTFKIVLGRNTYSIEVQQNGRRVEFTGRKWGMSITDALSRAAWLRDPNAAESGIYYLFARTDYYKDAPGIIDLWRASHYRE